jgi:hypothetical protein
MNREERIRMAREAGLDPDLWNYTDAFERFAALVAEHEREACARWCDIVAREVDDINGLAGYCAKGIRARGDR